MDKRCFVSAFDAQEDLLAAVRAARGRSYCIDDVYTPYAVHGLDSALGLRPSRLSWVCLALALGGASAGLWFQQWTSATDWPLNVGGKPFHSLPAFIPVTFELAVLLAGVGTVAALLARARLFPGRKPFLPEARATDDRFVLVIRETDGAFDPREACELFGAHRAVWCGELIDGRLCRLAERAPAGAPEESADGYAPPEPPVSPLRPKRHRRSTVKVGSN